MGYKSVFIIPLNATKSLTDDGWVFQSSIILPDTVIDRVISSLNLVLDEKKEGYTSYVNSDIKAVVLFDCYGNAEHIHLKVYSNDLSAVINVLDCNHLSEVADLFVPSMSNEMLK